MTAEEIVAALSPDEREAVQRFNMIGPEPWDDYSRFYPALRRYGILYGAIGKGWMTGHNYWPVYHEINRPAC